MKPNASAEIRGEFQPVATRVPGIQICEHLPRLAQQMDKVCLLRSMQHRMNVHGPACSEVFSGRPYHSAPITDQATPDDWPSLNAMTMRYGNSQTGLPPSVVLPWYLQFPGQGAKIAGQTGGRMGERQEDNFNKLKTLLCPMFDHAFPAFLRDLDDHGLLETTLVVAVGEFGRTPKLGQFTQSSNKKKNPVATTGLMPLRRCWLAVACVVDRFTAAQIDTQDS